MKRFMGIIMVFVLVLGLVAYAGGQTDVVKIGIIPPKSGTNYLEGLEEVCASQMAVDEVNKAGGILGGKQVVLVSEDGMARPAESLSAFEKLYNKDKVVAFTGLIYSSCTKAIMPALEKYGVPLVISVSTAPDITEGNLLGAKWIFRILPHDGLIPGAISKFILEDLKAKKIAMLVVNDDWGRQSAKLVEESLIKSGGEVIFTEFYNVGETNYLPQLTKITAKSPEVIFLVSSSQDGSMICKQLKEIGYEKAIFGLGSFAQDTFINLAKDAAEGVYCATQYVESIDTPENKEFVARYKALYPKMPGLSKNVFGPYTAMRILLQAIDQAGSTDSAKIAEALTKTKYNGLTGEISFDEKHQAHANVYIIVIKNGKPVIQNIISTK